MNFKLNQTCFWISKFLSQFFANITEVMLVTVVLGQSVVIICPVILTIFTGRMRILFVAVQVSPFVDLLFKGQNWFAFEA